ncbi:hypothetical protein GUJ93_ZPchr0002g26089 [Zizania palustris]|uniref:Uncharacterized protein n=1 Tax=Zizania palustris TaxID=103762 RepID=A0A8J5SRZ6_ZIZPA|nr:hypothetical protein GUJ93_ZPchr0002g26089 [Zizania palustris]
METARNRQDNQAFETREGHSRAEERDNGVGDSGLTARVLSGERMSDAATRKDVPPWESGTWRSPVHWSMLPLPERSRPPEFVRGDEEEENR